jgi:hypothetical protein
MLKLPFRKSSGAEDAPKPEPKPAPAFTARQRQPRGDIGGAANVGTTLTRMAVVLLSSVNAVMWDVYTESPVMAGIWLAIAIGFLGWMLYDARNR